jgi:RimJ/RimL family protein N-acetyltransferase
VPWPEAVSLNGRHVTLVPLEASHEAGLAEAVKDGRLWDLWYTKVPSPVAVAQEIERRLGLQARGAMLPFTVMTPDGKPAGMTTYMNIDADNRRVEIGSTWYRKSVQRTPLNSEAKLMLLTHASRHWAVSR